MHVLEHQCNPAGQILAPRLTLDFETRSAVDLRKTGVYVYAEHDSTDVWCAAYAVDDGPVRLWMRGQPCPEIVAAHVLAGHPIAAFNAAFERAVWSAILGPRYGWPVPRLEQWYCTMARALAQALPGSLENASAAVGLDRAKDAEGYRLMLRMMRPRRTENGVHIWWDDPDRVQRLAEYCVQDVVAERNLHDRLLNLRPSEQSLWWLDQTINDRGVHVDRELCERAQEVVEQAQAALGRAMKRASSGEISSCSAVQSIVDFCTRHGVDADSVRRDAVEELLARDNLPDNVRKVLEIRAEASKASVKKIDALLTGCSKDGRARGLLQYHAASTGRWAGRRFQPQNLKRPKSKDQDGLIRAVMSGKASVVELVAGPPLEIVGDILRGTVRAAPGKTLYAADYANIEGRGLAWLAGERWKIDAFAQFDQGDGPDLYKLSYSRAFGVPADAVNGDQRQLGKVMELALGYQGGVGAFQTMAYTYGVHVDDDRADVLKNLWREAHPRTKQLWYDVEEAAIRAVYSAGEAVPCGKLQFRVNGSFLFMRLPSGRLLCYPYPRIQKIKTPWGDDKNALTFKSVITVSNVRKVVPDPSNTSKWARISTYGGALVENAVQALARDVLAEAMVRVENAGYPVVLTVHDEIVSEAAKGSVEEFERLLAVVPEWAKGFPISAKAWSGPRYRKD